MLPPNCRVSASLRGKLLPSIGEGARALNLVCCRYLNNHIRPRSVDMRWVVPSLTISSFALAVCAGVSVLKSSCSVPELGATELFAGTGVFVSYGLLLLNIMLARKNFQRH